MRFPVVETTWKKWNEGGGYERLFGKSCTPHVFFADAASPDPANSIAAPCSGIYHMADLTVRPLLLVVGSEAVGISPEVELTIALPLLYVLIGVGYRPEFGIQALLQSISQ